MVEFYKVRVAGMEIVLGKGLRYTETDEWVRVEDGVAVVGITDFAQKELRDIVGVELPEPGQEFSKGDEIGVVESFKHTAPIYAPVSGVVEEVNERLYDEPELINRDPYGEGWLVRIRMRDPGEVESLLNDSQYLETIRRRKEK